MYRYRILSATFVLLVAALLASACTQRYIATYDAAVEAEILRVAKEVDLFWGRLLALPDNQRQYQKFQADYNRIEVDLRGLLMRNQIRPLNTLSTQQARNVLDLWLQDKARHRDKDGISDFIARRHRDDYVRMFVAMARGEAVKKTDAPDNE